MKFPRYCFRLIVGVTKIDYDQEKDNINRKKHGYSLSCAKDVFESRLLHQNPMLQKGPYFENGEWRHMHLAEYLGKVVVIVSTMRDNETVRLISFRVASDEERKAFMENPPRFA
jgi:uncharacterized DUF497 family protein